MQVGVKEKLVFLVAEDEEEGKLLTYYRNIKVDVQQEFRRRYWGLG